MPIYRLYDQDKISVSFRPPTCPPKPWRRRSWNPNLKPSSAGWRIEGVTKDMSEFEKPEVAQTNNFEVVETSAKGGLIYTIFFPTIEAAEKAVRDFWAIREGGMMVNRGIESGMLQPSRHTITSGDRTEPFGMKDPTNIERHPGMVIGVNFNGNTDALGPKGVEALKKLGFIK